MGIYVLFLSLISIYSIAINKGKIFLDGTNGQDSRKIKNIVIVISIGMVIIAALRHNEIGADTTVYLNALDYYRSLDKGQILSAQLIWPYDFEIGYFMLTKICALLNISDQMFLFIIAVLVYVPMCMWLAKYSEDPILSVYIYFSLGIYVYSLGLFRQMIAMSITLFAFEYIKERKLIKYTIVIVLAMFFHTTAVVVYPLYWIGKLKLTKSFKMIVGIEIIAFIFSSNIVSILSRFFPIYSSYIGSKYDDTGGSYLMLILLNLIYFLCYFGMNRNVEDKTIKVSFNATLYAIFLQIVAYSFVLMGRIVPYLTIYIMLLVPNVLKRGAFRNKKIVYVGVGIITIFLTFVNLIGSSINPYKFFWE